MGGTGSGRPRKPVIGKVIKEVIPLEDIFDDNELAMYKELLDVYMADFDRDELTSSDMDDIQNLAMNKVLAYRLLKGSKGDVDRQLDIATAIEKLDKRNEKIKESLSSRRRDRINPNELKGFSIVDLAVAYDQEVKRQHAERLEKLRKEEEEIRERRKDYKGNRYDVSENNELEEQSD